MSDHVVALNRRSFAAFVAAGLASCILYSSILLAFAFLLPVQIAYGRFGRRGGMAAAGLSAAGIVLVQGWRLAAIGQLEGAALGAGIIAPLVFLLALALMNASFWKGWDPAYRALCLTAVCALAAVPVVVMLERDTAIAAYLEGRIAAFLAPLRTATGQGYDAPALAAALDPKELVATSITTLRNSYAALLLLLLAGSWRLGNRWSGQGSRGREETGAIEELRLPYALLWAFLASWSLVLAVVVLHAPQAAEAFAWNCALTLTLAYAAQGFGVLTHLFKKWRMPKSLRVVFVVLAILALATPTGLAVAAALPLFGVTEIWIPYRKTKGVGA